MDAVVSTPRVSVVVTCYNYGRFVAAAIESALQQTHPAFEIIVVDDGSTDESPEIIKRFETRVRSIRQPNGGAMSAYNRGFAATTGDVVVFLDADDLLKPELLAELTRAWRPGCAKLQYGLDFIDGKDGVLAQDGWKYAPDYDAETVRREFHERGTYRWPVTIGNAYSRTLLQNCFPLDVRINPDGHINTVAPLYGDVVTIPKTLACYRLHGKNSWAPSDNELQRLSGLIAQRYSEIDYMRAHAARLEVELTIVNPLDYEITFITYRITAKKFGLAYPGADRDSLFKLWRMAFVCLSVEGLRREAKFAHLAWLTLIGVVPLPICRVLLNVRTKRRRYKLRLRALARPIWRDISSLQRLSDQDG
jgi:glycosyltransferase involved in cell wall biosynthesis